MKRQIRVGVFESNSSMTHSLTLCSDEQYEGWKNGEYYWNKWEDKIIPINEVEDMSEEERDNEGFRTYEEFIDEEDFEIFEQTYVTPGGELVHAFGYYGHD